MQSNKVFKDPSPSTAKPPTGRPQTQASSQTSIRTVASSHGAGWRSSLEKARVPQDGTGARLGKYTYVKHASQRALSVVMRCIHDDASLVVSGRAVKFAIAKMTADRGTLKEKSYQGCGNERSKTPYGCYICNYCLAGDFAESLLGSTPPKSNTAPAIRGKYRFQNVSEEKGISTRRTLIHKQRDSLARSVVVASGCWKDPSDNPSQMGPKLHTWPRASVIVVQ
ncbi:hypothetical protein EDB84DRAFT_1678494 [Lactarius hengduanensis]|nr:hypothetical protein EDB84DRAFT_1678494 [Lactarius hengduanensis]